MHLVENPGNPVILREYIPNVEVHKDCFYVPIQSGNFWENPYWGVYSSDGRIVNTARFIRWPNMALTGQSETCIADISNAKYAPGERYFYIGNIINHYGHFLCSTAVRFWALRYYNAEKLPLLGHALGTPEQWFSWPFASTLFGAAGICKEDFAVFDQPFKIKELIVPGPSFIELNLAHLAHATALHAIGDRLVKTQDIISREIAYISKQNYRAVPDGVSNEAALVDELKLLGVPIVYPHELTLPQQVAFFRGTKRILGQVGSAFHTNMLSSPRDGQHFICINGGPNVYSTNHALADLANRNRSSYVYLDGQWVRREGGNPGFEIADPKAAANQLVEYAYSS